MLDILAWAIFIPAVGWNIVFLAVAFVSIVISPTSAWMTCSNMRHLVLSLAILFIPGVYLFGWF